MCHLVTIGTRENRAIIDTLMGDDFPLSVRPSMNPFLRSIFPHTDQLFEITHGFCSCDIVVDGREPPTDDQRAKLRAHYASKGWSEAKIARALADSDSALDRRLKKSAEPAMHLIGLLRTLAARPGGVRVLIHFYGGRFDNEEIRLVGTARVSDDRLVNIGVIAEDTLTDVRRLG
jgi:hypothetical protein